MVWDEPREMGYLRVRKVKEINPQKTICKVYVMYEEMFCTVVDEHCGRRKMF